MNLESNTRHVSTNLISALRRGEREKVANIITKLAEPISYGTMTNYFKHRPLSPNINTVEQIEKAIEIVIASREEPTQNNL